MHKLNIKQFKTATFLTLGLGVSIFILNYFIGTNNFFLLLNTNLGIVADYFFHYYTYLGDGVFWIPVLLIVYFYKREYLILVIAAILFSTVFTHIFKNWLMQGEPRPTKAITDLSLIHVVKGVALHSIDSFPSGHSTTAFCFYLLTCLFFNKKWVVVIGLIFALLVGYSRIYLAQHFPRDVAGGMLVAVISIALSIKIQSIDWASRYSKK
ncbi:MAG: phosphatase PAP2 family protein [Bacteroidetes bacterium]|nr:phosphatase PAP2 family protein [Bacteroidota bacterium]MBS1648555.1 phosphatase PAP2 family protein [Bacteroidota bacterium]